jgi:hypothetical protein
VSVPALVVRQQPAKLRAGTWHLSEANDTAVKTTPSPLRDPRPIFTGHSSDTLFLPIATADLVYCYLGQLPEHHVPLLIPCVGKKRTCFCERVPCAPPTLPVEVQNTITPATFTKHIVMNGSSRIHTTFTA